MSFCTKSQTLWNVNTPECLGMKNVIMLRMPRVVPRFLDLCHHQPLSVYSDGDAALVVYYVCCYTSFELQRSPELISFDFLLISATLQALCVDCNTNGLELSLNSPCDCFVLFTHIDEHS